MVKFNNISKPPIQASNLVGVNKGESLQCLSKDNLSTLNGWRQSQTAGSTLQASNIKVQASNDISAQIPVSPKLKPFFTNLLKKGQKTSIDSSSHILDVRLGLNVLNKNCDVDVSAFLVGKDGKVQSEDWFVFYGQPQSPDGSTAFSVLKNETDNQKIIINTEKLSEKVEKIIFVLSINEALEKSLNFSMITDAYLRILDESGNEICSYEMEDYYDNVTSMIIGEIYRHNESLKFNPVGQGMAKDLSGLCETYGVTVE